MLNIELFIFECVTQRAFSILTGMGKNMDSVTPYDNIKYPIRGGSCSFTAE